MKHYFLLLGVLFVLVGCSKEPTQVQLDVINDLIQEQINTLNTKPDMSSAKDYLLKQGKTVKQAEEQNKKLYSDIQEYLTALKNKPYKEKKQWAVYILNKEIDVIEQVVKSNKDVKAILKQKKKMLKILK